MAIFGLFADNRPTIKGLGSTFFFDGSISEQHRVDAEWTSEPVEDGSEISDNRIIKPRLFTITAIVSSAETFFDRQAHTKAWARLRSMVTAQPAQLFEITTTLEGYPHMALLSASVPVTATSGTSITATIQAREIQLARTAIATNLADAAQDGGQAETDLGTQGFEEANTNSNPLDLSALDQIALPPGA